MTSPQTTVDVQGTHVDQGPGLLELVRLVDRLQTDVRERSEAATLWQARAEMLAHQLSVTEDQLGALEASRAPVALNLGAHAPDPPSAWWRRWWRALGAEGGQANSGDSRPHVNVV